MNERKFKSYVLKLVDKDGNVEPLLDLGYNYAEIADIIENLISTGLVINDNGILSLSENGISFINNESKDSNKKHKQIWIEPEHHSRIDKLKLNEVYLPELEELWMFDNPIKSSTDESSV